jgi:hypothetical protein
MRQYATDRAITRAIQSAFGMSREQEDSLWSRFAARRSLESAAWAAFAVGMVLLNAGLRPAIRSAYWTASYSPRA